MTKTFTPSLMAVLACLSATAPAKAGTLTLTPSNYQMTEVTPAGLAIDYMTCMIPMYSNDQYPLPPVRPGTYRNAVTGKLIIPASFIPFPHVLIIEPWGTPDFQRIYAQETDNGATCWPGRD